MKLLFYLIVLIIAGNSHVYAGVFEYQPAESVKYIVQTKDIKQYPNIGSVFLFIELTVRNQSPNELYLDLGRLNASLNGISSTATHYDSLASVIPKKEKLASGESQYQLYFVFPENAYSSKTQDFNLIKYGLTKH